MNKTEEKKITVIPQRTKDEIMGFSNRKRKVAAYARVSTGTEQQESSFDLQVEYYTKKIKSDPDWEFVDIYSDEGISGTNVHHRKGFQKMIEDCEAGKIDLILAKSISRFARNVADLLNYMRKLQSLNVEVRFESEGISTMGAIGEMLIIVLGIAAQEESRAKSDAITVACDWRYASGRYLTTRLFGYNKEKGNPQLLVNEEESKAVCLCFSMAIYGYSLIEIAENLNKLDIKGAKGKVNWTAGRVKSLLSNEKYCGDLLARKTITPSYLDHRAKKNEGEKPQYYVENHHTAIIPKLADDVAKRIIKNRRGWKTTGYPCLKAIDEGALQGFVTVNQHYSGFTYDEYKDVSDKVRQDDNIEILVKQTGVFDFRGYEAASPLLFDLKQRPSCRLQNGYIKFNAQCVKEMQTEFVEILYHPHERVLAVRPATVKGEGVRIAYKINGKLIPQKALLRDFLDIILEQMNLKIEYSIRCFGEKRDKHIEKGRKMQKEWILFFDLKESEIMLEKEIAIPQKLIDCYGKGFYERLAVCGIRQIDLHGLWEALKEGQPFDSLAGQMIELQEFCETHFKGFNLELLPMQQYIGSTKEKMRKSI